MRSPLARLIFGVALATTHCSLAFNIELPTVSRVYMCKSRWTTSFQGESAPRPVDPSPGGGTTMTPPHSPGGLELRFMEGPRHYRLESSDPVPWGTQPQEQTHGPSAATVAARPSRSGWTSPKRLVAVQDETALLVAERTDALVRGKYLAQEELQLGPEDSESHPAGSIDDGGEGSLWVSRGLLAIAAAFYGTNFGCVKLLEESMPMTLAAALRFSVAVLPFLPSFRSMKPGVFRAGLEIGVLNALGYWAQSQSLVSTTASKSAFICSLAVVLVPFLDAVFAGRDGKGELESAEGVAADKKAGVLSSTLSGPWFPALLAATGVACLELIGSESACNIGDLWAMAQPLCFGLGFWRTEHFSRRFAGETHGIVAAQMLTVAVLSAGWCIAAGELPPSIYGLRDIIFPASGSLAIPLALLWTGLVTTALTQFWETLAMKRVSAAESTVILSTEPIWGTAFASVVLGETVGWNTGLGAALITLACMWPSVVPALQSKLLSMVAMVGAAGPPGEADLVDVDVEAIVKTIGDVSKGIME